jgi:opacity protein-like surface antigen
MTTLALLIALTAGDLDLPPTLASEPDFTLSSENLEGRAAKAHDVTWTVGGHLGVASSFDSDDAGLLIGGQGRVRILPWLGAEVSLDFQTSQSYESGDIHVWMFDIQFSALFYAPVDWPVKPYGVAAIGFYYEDISYSGALSYQSNKTAFEPGFHFGFGAEYAVTPQITLDADFRFVFLTHPGGLSGNDLNFFQFTVGINFKIG